MNVPQLFHKLRLISHIEIVVALLPEMLGLANQPPRDSLLQRLDRVGESLQLRLAEQQVNVFGHDDIAVDAKSEAEAHALQRVLENLSGDGCRERGPTMVTAEGHEVSLPGRLESFQSPRDKARLRLETAPPARQPSLRLKDRAAFGVWNRRDGLVSHSRLEHRNVMKVTDLPIGRM